MPWCQELCHSQHKLWRESGLGMAPSCGEKVFWKWHKVGKWFGYDAKQESGLEMVPSGKVVSPCLGLGKQYSFLCVRKILCLELCYPK